VYFEVFVPGQHVPAAGEEEFVKTIRLGLGGALNTASVASALGLSVTLASPRGDGLSDGAIVQRVAQLGIATAHWPARADPAVSLVFSGPDDRAFLSAADFASLGQCEVLPNAQWIHVPGLLEARYLAAPLAKARAAGARISVSASWAPGELAALKNIRSQPWDLLVLNSKEAALAASDPSQAPARLQGAAADVVVTDGANGAFGLLGGHWVSCPGVAAIAVTDFTGAGDAFCGGLLAAVIRNIEGGHALNYACKVAARLLTQSGGVVESPAFLADLEMKK
jgi:ribokinase